MQLTTEQNNTLHHAIAIEVKTQEVLARARDAAASVIAAYFKANPTTAKDDTTRCPDRIRVAIQFTARPFQPLTLLLRAAARRQPTETDTASHTTTQPDDDSTTIVEPNRAMRRYHSARQRRARSSAGRRR